MGAGVVAQRAIGRARNDYNSPNLRLICTEVGLCELILGCAGRIGLFRIQHEDVSIAPIVTVPALVVRQPDVLPEGFVAIIFMITRC